MLTKILKTAFVLVFSTISVFAQFTPKMPSLDAKVVSPYQIDLEWKQEGSNFDEFILQRKSENDLAYATIKTFGVLVRNYSDKDLKPKTTYYYRIKARNFTFFGTFDSNWSDEIKATTLSEGPDRPTSLEADAASQTSIKLSWKDNSADEDKFVIHRSKVNQSNYSEITSVNSNTTSYTDNGLASSTRYHYRVFASNGNGNSSFSNAANDKTWQYPPTLDDIPDPNAIPKNAPTQTINLSGITAGGSENQALTVTATSNNTPLIGNPTVSYSSPNQTGSISYKPKTNQSGTATITVTITDNGSSQSPNVNKVSKTFSVTVSNELPDLSFSEVIVDREIAGFGQKIKVQSFIKNIGVKPSTLSVLKYFLSTNNTFSNNDTPFASFSDIPALAVDQEKAFEDFITMPDQSIGEGDYYIIFFADANKQVSEKNEKNNVKAVKIALTLDIPPVITQTDFPEFVDAKNDKATIKISAEDEGEITEVNFIFRGIRSPNWDTTLVNKSGEYYTVEVPSAKFDEIGLEYFFEVIDDVGLKAISETSYTYVKYPQGTNFPSLQFGDSENDYQIIAVPLVQYDSKISSILNDDLGKYNKRKWRMFHYGEGKLAENENGLSLMAPGKGYWLIARKKNTVDTEAGNTVEVHQQKLFEITLHSGWNQIGNPYNFDISWADVLEENGFPSGLSALRTYEKGYKNPLTLKSFQGALISATEEITLRIPLLDHSKNRKSTNGRIASNQPLGNVWEVGLTLKSGNTTHQINSFGMNNKARLGIDEFDEINLPNFGFVDDVALSFKHDLTKDIVPVAENYIWDFDLDDNGSGRYIELSWNTEKSNSDIGNELYLYDIAKEQVINMNVRTNYWAKTGNSKNFKIFYGNQSFIDDNLKPQKILLGNAYPNPFNHTTAIPLALQKSNAPYFVKIKIFNGIGQQISTITSQNYNEGFHEIKWDGTDHFGNNVKPGLYIYKLTVKNKSSNTTQSGRVVLR